MSATGGEGSFRLTGRWVLALVVLFFGAIFAVNGAMVYYALSTFPGLEVASSYKAGQDYESEIAAGRDQAARGWRVDGDVVPQGSGARIAFHFADAAGADLHGLAVAIRLVHAVDPTHDHAATLVETGSGLYAAALPDVPDGHWRLSVEARRDGERLFKSRNELLLRREAP